MAYQAFADYYDYLTKNVDYKRRAAYLMDIFEKLNHKTFITLDLACGTGSLTLELARLGVDVYGIDSSAEMLSVARQKCADEGFDILFLKQKMQSIDLYGTIDTCICSLDSINHLTDIKDVQKTFDRVSLFMNRGGYFVFDANTVYKHNKVLGDNTFIYDTDKVFCAWRNSLQKNNTVKIELDFFAKDGSVYYRTHESFSERAYTDEELTEMLRKSGFELVNVFEELSFDKPSEKAERSFFIARKL